MLGSGGAIGTLSRTVDSTGTQFTSAGSTSIRMVNGTARRPPAISITLRAASSSPVMRLVPEPEHLVSAFVNEWRTFGTDKTFDIPPGGTFEESVGFAIERNRYDTVNVP